MSDKGWDRDEATGDASFRPVDNGADAWGAPEPDVPAIPVDDAHPPSAWRPDPVQAPAVGDADPVWAVPAPGPEAETDPVWAIRSRLSDPEPEAAPDPVWAAPAAPDRAWDVPGQPAEPTWSAPAAPDPVWAVPAAPEPAWSAPAAPDPVWAVPAAPDGEPHREADPAWATPAAPSEPSASRDPWGNPPASSPAPAADPWGAATGTSTAAERAPGAAADPWGIAATAASTTPVDSHPGGAPGPLSDRLAHAAPTARPAQPGDPFGAQTPATGTPSSDQGYGTRSSSGTGTGSTPAAAAAGWPTTTPSAAAADWQRTNPAAAAAGQPSWPAASAQPPSGRAETAPGTAAGVGYGAGQGTARPSTSLPGATPAAGAAAGWPAGIDPRAAAWPAEPRSPYAPPPTGYPQGGHAQGSAGYGQPSGWPQGTYGQAGQGQAQPGYSQGQGQGTYAAGAWSAQQSRSGYGQPPAAGQWSQGQWTGQPQPGQAQPGQPQPGQAGWAGYQNPGWTNQPAVGTWDQAAAGPAAGTTWGATNAPYWQGQDAAMGTARYGRSIAATLAGIILFVFGTLLAIAGVMVFMAGTSVNLDEYLDRAGLTTVDRDAVHRLWDLGVGLSAFVAVVGGLELIGGLLVLAHRTFGRVLGILFGLAGTLVLGLLTVLLLQVPAAVQADGSTLSVTGTAIPVGVLAAIYLFVFLALAAGGKHFRRGA